MCVWRIRAADEKHRRERSEGSASLSRLYHTVLGGRRGSEIAPCPALPDLHLAHLLHSYRRLVPILAVLRGHGTNGDRGASDKSREGHGPACLDAREVQRDLCEPRAPTQGHSKRAPRRRTAHKSVPPPTLPGANGGGGRAVGASPSAPPATRPRNGPEEDEVLGNCPSLTSLTQP